MSHQQISIAFQTDKSAAEYIALAKLVDEFDFDAVSVYCDAPFQPSYGPLMLMAPHLRRARIGPAAVSPLRIHPIDIASETALLESLLPGRTYIGIARGAWLAEHGIPERTWHPGAQTRYPGHPRGSGNRTLPAQWSERGLQWGGVQAGSRRARNLSAAE